MITLLGSTGTIGRALLTELVGRGVRVRALVRPGSVLPAGVAEPVEGDLTRPGTLTTALAGTGSLFLLTPLHPAQDMLQQGIVDAARRAGVRHVVKVSALGADPTSACRVHRQHGIAEQAVAESGIRYTMLRPNAFMQNARQWLPSIAARGELVLPVGDAKVSMVDARDVAAVAAVALTTPPRTDAVLELTGPQALDYPTAADLVGKALGLDVRHVDVDPDTAKAALTAAGMPPWAVEARLELYATYRAGLAATVTDTVERWTGRPARRFADYVGDLRLV
ncbi:NmrA family NAD(P)-binding protein [Saccharothrix deserti]|uniref:NmrA family NAD(P)-binding protein n=1 Tax=Saccharothrix deserti TaxID=2593674 RepID=UPI00131ADD91|nr:NAD(P)H-binding protein [Saccharothrix deserti]